MSLGDLFGFVGGAIITFSLIPQVIRLFKLKSAREISMLFTSLLLAGTLFWLVYGIYFRLRPIILWNTIGAVLDVLLLVAKLKYGRQ